VAGYKKKRARQLKHDKFRDTTMGLFDRLGDKLEGKGRTILYGLGALIALAIISWLFTTWRAKKADEAEHALGRAIEIASAPVSTSTPLPGAPGPNFASETARAQSAVEEFQKVADKYGDPYRIKARYFIATNLLTLDREKALGQLDELSKSGDAEVGTLAKFALAQAREADARYDDAAALYSALAKQNGGVVTQDVANFRLASVYEKQGKKQEAAEILFNIANNARNAKDKEGKPVPLSSVARQAAQELQKIDPERFAKLPAEPTPGDLLS
jgi:predicted negative regulator of RcsB-dependent stress response